MTCWAIARGCRGHVGTIAVPSPIRSVRTAAAAAVVSESPRKPPRVSHVESMPASSAATMRDTAVALSCAWMATPTRPLRAVGCGHGHLGRCSTVVTLSSPTSSSWQVACSDHSLPGG